VLIIQSWIRLGGAELISVHLASQLQARGHEVAIACVYADLRGMPREALGNDYLIPPRWVAELCSKHRTAFLLLSPLVLLWQTWRHSANVDVLNPHNFPSGWIAILVGAVRRIPVVWTCNEPPERPGLRLLSRIGLADFIGWTVASSFIDKLLMKRAKAIYVPSERTRAEVLERYGRRASVVGLGIDEEFRSPASPSGLADRLGVQDRFVLLLVGKLHPQKNQIACIEALPKLVERIPQVVMLVAGNGPARMELEDAASRLGVAGHVRFLGHVSRSETRELYEICDLNLFPAVNQSWGLTPFEALAAGRLSVVSEESGAAELLKSEDIGIVCDPNADAFAQRIVQIYEDPAAISEMASRGRDYVIRNLSWARYAETATAIFQEACGLTRSLSDSPASIGAGSK
jgi:glycosyltransferase involved in cell wall biosynthesis